MTYIFKTLTCATFIAAAFATQTVAMDRQPENLNLDQTRPVAVQKSTVTSPVKITDPYENPSQKYRN